MLLTSTEMCEDYFASMAGQDNETTRLQLTEQLEMQGLPIPYYDPSDDIEDHILDLIAAIERNV